MTPPLRLDVADRVATLTLTRPERLNRFDAELHTEFDRALDELHRFTDVRAAVLASTGTAFSAGGDFDFILDCHDDPVMLQRFVDEGRHLLTRLVSLPYPIVAAVQGPAIGLGATVALGCDMVVAARAARFADPHVVVGLVAGDGGCLVWPQTVGMHLAKRHLLTGDPLPAAEAHRFGVVTDLVDEPDQVLPAARALAARLAALPPVAVQGTKRALNAVMGARAAEVVDVAFSYEQRSALSDDLVEAVAAAKDRRPGEYRGR
jgi:enoyl-CoA hydratase